MNGSQIPSPKRMERNDNVSGSVERSVLRKNRVIVLSLTNLSGDLV